MFVTNLLPLDLIHQLYQKSRYNWEPGRAKKAELLLASLLRKILVMSVCDLTFRDSEGSLNRVEHATMNQKEICAKLGLVDEDPDPVAQKDLLQPTTSIRYFDLDKKVWAEVDFEEVGVFIMGKELSAKFTDSDGGVAALKKFVGDDWPE